MCFLEGGMWTCSIRERRTRCGTVSTAEGVLREEFAGLERFMEGGAGRGQRLRIADGEDEGVAARGWGTWWHGGMRLS